MCNEVNIFVMLCCHCVICQMTAKISVSNFTQLMDDRIDGLMVEWLYWRSEKQMDRQKCHVFGQANWLVPVHNSVKHIKTVGRGGSLVESTPIVRRVVGGFDSRSIRHLRTLSSCGASAWNSDTISVLCQECLWVLVDLKRRYINSLNEWMNEWIRLIKYST